MAAVLIDPKTGERIQVAGTPQIDPATGERVQSPMKPPATPIGGDLRPLTEREQMSTTFPVGETGESAFENVHNSLRDAFTGAYGVIAHPYDTAKGLVKSLIPGTDTPNPVQSTYQGLNTRPGETISTAVGQTAATAPVAELAPRIAAPVLEKTAPKLQDAGAAIYNKVGGMLKSDYKRGANPGRAYLDAGGTPALAQAGLASKAADLKSATGAKIGAAYDNATKNNVLIPPSEISAAINPPIDAARAVITGPGGTGNVAPLDNFADSFKPTLYPRVSTGAPPSLTPNDLFSMKKNVSANTNWSDPTQFGMKKVSQQTAGALGGVLENAVPEVKPLNSQYQGLTNFANRTTLRAQTGSSPLTSLFGKAAAGAGGALTGAALHNPVASVGLGLGGLALDSIPVKTTLGYGLYQAGRGAAAIGSKLRSLY